MEIFKIFLVIKETFFAETFLQCPANQGIQHQQLAGCEKDAAPTSHHMIT